MSTKLDLTEDERRARERERTRKYRKTHPEKVRETERKRRVAKREYNRKYREANLEKLREYDRKKYAANPKKKKEEYRKWRVANPAKRRAQHTRYYAAHTDKHRKGTRKWKLENPEKVKAMAQKRRALKAGNGGSFTDAEWQALKAKYGNKCIGPGPHGGELEPDHVIPVNPCDGTRGGTSNIDNIQPLCGRCNRRKSNKTIDYRPLWQNSGCPITP